MCHVIVVTHDVIRGPTDISSEYPLLHEELDELKIEKHKSLRSKKVFYGKGRSFCFRVEDSAVRVLNVLASKGFEIVPGTAGFSHGCIWTLRRQVKQEQGITEEQFLMQMSQIEQLEQRHRTKEMMASNYHQSANSTTDCSYQSASSNLDLPPDYRSVNLNDTYLMVSDNDVNDFNGNINYFNNDLDQWQEIVKFDSEESNEK